MRGDIDADTHRLGHTIGVHDHPTFRIPGCPPGGLQQGLRRPQETLLIRVQDGHEGHLWEVESFPEEVDPHEHVYPMAIKGGAMCDMYLDKITTSQQGDYI